MDDELDLQPTRLRPSKGRRAKKAVQSPAEIEKSVSDLELVDKKEKPEKPPRARNRQMGWGSSPSAEVEEVVDARLIQRDDDEEDETELQFIPDLDEIQEEDMVQEVAAPPQAFNKDIATYRELDVDLMNRAAFRTIDDTIDMKVLVKNLSSQAEIVEEADIVWDWDKLFADVCSNLKTKKTVPAEADVTP